ncbi:hypothetical protein [Rhodopila sp.]|uniref:hypothetical protein n=1 Tax=Rhodopila sp. TaxID=2480087 RepID=UPI003D0AFBEE
MPLLGVANRVLGLTRRFTACFGHSRDSVFVEHSVQTLITQRIIGIALGYEISTITTHGATIRCWRCWPTSSLPRAAIAPRWPARAR